MDKIRTVTSNTLNSPSKILIIAAFIILILAAIFAAVYFFTNSTQEENEQLSQQEQQFAQQKEDLKKFAQPNTIILYGSQTSSGIDIYAFDLQSTEEYFITTLPHNIKQITPIADNQLLYLDKTNDLDYAKRLNIRSLENDSSQVIYEVVDNYGIDTYVLSPDKSYLVTWEVELGPTGSLQGGNSRLRTIDLSDTSNTSTITQQQITGSNPLYYPVLAKNDRTLYVDTFLPNSGAGWAYGMSTINLETGTIQPIPSMTNGTYSTRPVASPDGSEILFAGYDGSQGDGAQEDENGFRTALIFANTIEILDTSTNQRQQLSNLPEGNTYLRLKWGNTPNTIIYAALDQNINTIEAVYDVSQSTTREIDSSADTITAVQLENNLFLQGTISENSTNYLSNLGANTVYQYSYNKLELKDLSKNDTVQIPTTSALTQYIDTIHTSASRVQSEDVSIQQFLPEFDLGDIIEFGERVNTSFRNIQLKTFQVPTPIEREIITEPEPTQPDPTQPVGSNPVPQNPSPNNPQPTSPPSNNPPPAIGGDCTELSNPICFAKFGVSKYEDLAPEDIIDFKACRVKLNKEFKADGKCEICPLFLYGPEGEHVVVQVHTNISNANIPVSNNSFSATLSPNGNVSSGGKKHNSISFNYIKSKNIAPPKHGAVIKSSQVSEKLEEYGKKLGFTEREIQSLQSEATAKVHSDYVFVSFYSQEVSKYILPMTFDPQPDTYINYAFYVKNLATPQALGYSPKEPEFGVPQKRGEFTAVEVSVVSD